MANKKGDLLENLFNAIEKRQIAEIEEEIANREMQACYALYFDRDNEELLKVIREHTAKEIELLMARAEADEAYDAYIAYLREEKGAAANEQ